MGYNNREGFVARSRQRGQWFVENVNDERCWVVITLTNGKFFIKASNNRRLDPNGALAAKIMEAVRAAGG